MRLSDIMSGLDLTAFPKAALVIFLIVFAAVMARVLCARRSDMDRAASLPLDDEPTRTTNGSAP